MKAIRVVFVMLAFSLAFLLAANTLTYLNFDPSYRFLRLKQDAIASGWYLPAYYSHIFVSGIILIVGFFQLFPSSSQKFRKTHRVMGYIYIMGILFFAAPGGLIMSLFINRGIWVLASFITLAVLWFAFTAQAFTEIRKGKVPAHKQWMWRSYALTFSAITLRLYIFISASSMDLGLPEAYATIAWVSWVPNLLIVELCIRMKLKTLIN